MDGKRIGRVDAPSQVWFDSIEPPTRLRSRKERESFLHQVRRRGSIFRKKQFWLDNLEPTPKLRSRVDRGSASFLEQVKRRGSEAIIKVKEVGIIWGGSLVLQTVIGPGIFTSPKGVLQFGGSVGLSYVIWAWSGLISMLAALCFVELQLSVPRAGCEYGYIHKAFGRIPTFIYTWMRIALAEPVTTAVFTIAFADYVADTVFDNCGPAQTIRKLIAVVAAVSLTVMNGIFRKLSKGLNVLANIGKCVTLTVVILCGVYNLCRGKTTVLQQGFEHTQTEYDSIVIAIYNSLWAYGGWANVPHVTAGVRRPPRNLPLLILTVIPFVTCVYLLTVTSFLTVLSRNEMMSAQAIGVVEKVDPSDRRRVYQKIHSIATLYRGQLWGQKMWIPFGYIIPVFVAFIALGNANGTFLSAGRTASVAVHDGYIPELLSYVHVKTKIHVPAVAARCVGTIILIFITDVGSLLRFYVFTVWLFHGVTMLGLLVMRWKKTSYYKPYKVPIFVPVIVLLFSLVIVVVPFTAGVPRKEFIFSVVVAALSVVGFLPFGKAKRFMKYLDWAVVLTQLLMNVIPPKIQRHKQSRSLRPTRKFTPASMKLSDTLYTPGRFSTTSTSSLEDTDMSPIRRVRFAFPKELYRDEERKISTVSTYSNASIDYCEVMTDYDEAHGENDSLTGSNSSTDSAQSAVSVELIDRDDSERTDIDMDEVEKQSPVGMQRSVSVNSTTPLLVSTVISEKL